MRFGKWCVALAMGLAVMVVGCAKSEGEGAAVSVSATDAAAVETPSRVTKDPNVKYTRVSLEVPTMSCPFACWPKVKETLESQAGVGEVTLSPQKDKDAIDNPVVFIEVSDQFQTETAVEALSKVGFDGAKVAAK